MLTNGRPQTGQSALQTMSEFLYKGRTRRNLPHIHPPGATLFVTFRLAGTVPQAVLRLYHARKK